MTEENKKKEKEMGIKILLGIKKVMQPNNLSSSLILFCILMLVLSVNYLFASAMQETKPEKLTIVAHKVHRIVSEKGKNLIEKFKADNDLKRVGRKK